MTRILVTNDDGIAAEGLRQLALCALALELDVVVAAPRDDQSGTSASLASIQSDGQVVVETRSLEGLGDVPTHAVAAAPGHIALMAIRGAFGTKPDVILSGINRGANTGNSILHSGTVGAALTGYARGCRAMAVSLMGNAPTHWETAAAVARDSLHQLLGVRRAVVLNINVPDLPAGELRGLRRARLARFGVVQTTVTELGSGYVRLGVSDESAPLEAGTDTALLAEGYATITPLSPICEMHDVEIPWVDDTRVM